MLFLKKYQEKTKKISNGMAKMTGVFVFPLSFVQTFRKVNTFVPLVTGYIT